MQNSDEDADEEPITNKAQTERESAGIVKEWTRIGSILSLILLLIVLIFMQTTGLIDLLVPILLLAIEDTEIDHWFVFVALALISIAIFIWSWEGVG